MFICSACNGEINPKNRFSVLVECPYCHTTYRKVENAFTNTGKIASLPPDMSFVQVGTTGQYDGKSFTVIGRIKVGWRNGNWNEWWLQFSDDSTGWLADFIGEFCISFPGKLEHQPKIEDLKVDQVIDIAGTPMVITDLKKITYIGFEGELPFERQEGMSAMSIDLASQGKACAFLDNFDNNINVYIGKQVDVDELNLENIRLLDGW